MEDATPLSKSADGATPLKIRASRSINGASVEGSLLLQVRLAVITGTFVLGGTSATKLGDDR
jgi:hypothetical protein